MRRLLLFVARCRHSLTIASYSRLPTYDLRLVQPQIPELHAALELRVPAANCLRAEGDVAGVTDLDRRNLGVVGLLDLLEDRHAGLEIGLGEQLRGELEAALRAPPTGILVHLSDVGDLAWIR